jgi:hypothetical protein
MEELKKIDGKIANEVSNHVRKIKSEFKKEFERKYGELKLALAIKHSYNGQQQSSSRNHYH